MTKETSLPAKQRIWELDALRGLCILCMVAIHAFWDLSAFGGFAFDLPGWFLFCRQYGHILFILLSGLCATLASRSFQRGVYVFGAALVISYVTFFMVNVLNFPSDMLIWFGILHMLGVCMMLFPLFKRLPVWALAVLGVGFVALGVWFESFRIPVNFLFPLGLRAQGFYCGGDYFPLLPGFGWFLLGAVIGASQTGKAEGALAGAAIGAGAGAGASYLVAKYNNERDDRVRLASYARDLNADVNSLNRVTAAGQVAYNCYSAKFRAALEDYKAKRITRAELDQRYAEIKSGLAEASAILGSTLSEADKREAEYRQVLTVEAKKASRPIPPVQTVATTSKKTSKATKTVTRKQTGDQLQNLSNGVGSYKESTAQLTAVKSDLDEIQLQMDKVMLAQG